MSQSKNNEFPFKWMKRTFEEIGVTDFTADFRMSQRVVQLLNELKQRNEKADKIVNESFKAMQFITDAAMENSNINLTIPTLQLDPSCLSSEALKAMNIILRLNDKLGKDSSTCSDSSNSAVELASLAAENAKAILRKDQLTSEAKKLDETIKFLNNHVNGNKIELKKLGEDEQKLAKQHELETVRAEKEMLQQQYVSQAELLEFLQQTEAQVAQVENLLNRLSELVMESSKLKTKLDEYHGIPCNIQLAKLALGQKQKDLQELKGEIAFLVGTMATEYN